jgi:predicted metal-dependent enzyme (double-stranded beta helix superfamily)
MGNSAAGIVRALENLDAPGLADTGALGEVLKRYAEPVSLLCDGLTASDGAYRRLLLYRSDLCEVLLLQWGRGASSAIHDHANQTCVFTPLRGELAVDDYEIESRKGSGRVVLHQTRTGTIGPGSLDSRRGDLDIHRVTSTHEALSLHIYAAPLARCNIFRTDTQRRRSIPLAYDEVRLDLLAAQ